MTKTALYLRTFYLVVCLRWRSAVRCWKLLCRKLLFNHSAWETFHKSRPPPPHANKSIFTVKIIYLKTELGIEYGNMA